MTPNESLVEADKIVSGLLEIDWSDQTKAYELLVEFLSGYIKEFETRKAAGKDTFYLKKTALWLVELFTAMTRDGFTFSSYPKRFGAILDSAYGRIVEDRFDGMLAIDSYDRDFQVVLQRPKDVRKASKIITKENMRDRGSAPELTVG